MSKRRQHIHSQDTFEKAKILVCKDGYSIRKAAKELNIPYTTLRDHINGSYAGYDTQFGQSRMLDPQDELSVVNYATFMASRGVPLTRPVLKRIAYEVIMQRGGDKRMNSTDGPSDNWIRRFLKRNSSLTVQTAHPLERERAIVSQDVLDDSFNLLSETLVKLGLTNEPSRIFNCDESGFSGKINPSKKVIVPKGTRHAYQSVVNMTGHITLLNSISASGQTTPPMLIFSQCLPRSYSEGLPDSWTFRTTDKGYITTELFLEWFLRCFVPYIGERRPVLLILDNHSTHLSKEFIDAATEHNVDLLYLPAHPSHLLQPQDVGYFHVLKQKIADIAVSLGYLGVKTLPRSLFPKILQQAFNRVLGTTICAAFICTGIYPLDKMAVKALVPAISKKSTESQPDNQSNIQSSSQTHLCETCGRSTENVLVKLGIVSSDLASILVEPPAPKPTGKCSNSKRKTFTSARAVLSKKKLKSTCSTMVEPDTFSLLPDVHNQAEEVLCVVCMMPDRDGYFWVGCDTCDKWFHYECLPGAVQTDVDLSLLTSSKWYCRYCMEE